MRRALAAVVIAIAALAARSEAQPAPDVQAPMGPGATADPDVRAMAPPTAVDAEPPAAMPVAAARLLVTMPAPAPVAGLTVTVPPYDDGRHLTIAFTRAEGDLAEVATLVLRRAHAEPILAAVPPIDPAIKLKPGLDLGGWTVAALLEAAETSVDDTVDPHGTFDYLVVEVHRDDRGHVIATSAATTAGPFAPHASLFNWSRVAFLAIILIIAGLFFIYVRRARERPQDVYIRRMPGVDAIEDAVGRSTEMGRPVLYVTGIEEVQDIMTLASLLILGHVAELTAAYDTEIKVANYYPLTMIVAEEVVRAGYAKAGRADAHRPENVLFITAEQFAFAAGVNGIILRDRPATNIYFGRFYGESLLLAETGFVTGAVQIAGTAELTQLPFFVAACDYALIGEELYATSAYLSREPTLLANIKAGDGLKLIAMIFIVVGVVLATTGSYDLAGKVFP